ncbi:Acetyltransferase (GNAT) family protein [Caprobacter fermentans]|uniref:Acetyltransferase (GNAT) family protein n=1 Tax=Caproicibacter fermentans TaxID=2576756 RepID=A0A6N8I1K6_9FIRM|nr:GNAT family N-acetyltransferase [Caproicibacter fermentans]MVB11991.1 Acetyltransferase (GNAT) family protein [Caproicibacter fermentans]OCN00598.1 GCN5 family acetyltransferase [Clostridium sp. W14A]QNK39281.1 GNAT family N-acetyltransferase [Caproicibacter fermentans]
MRYKYTNGSEPDFILLCHELDEFLNKLVGGEENRLQYIPYNQLDDIHDVVIVYDGDKPIGCASFKHYDVETAEVKRVFIREEYRGKDISKKLMELLEQSAKKQGYKKFVLESGEPLIAAMKLYRAIGYFKIKNFGQYKDMPDSVCMEKIL